MNVNLVIEIATLALAIADRQTARNLKGDPFYEETLLEIIQKAAQAYRDHTGEPLDPSLIKAEDPA